MATRAAVIAALRLVVARRCWVIQTNAHAELTATTPVDTGAARANWQATLDAPASGVVAATSPSSPMAEPTDPADAGRLRFVSNRIHYIRRLDAGHSKQAPAGFVRMAVARAVSS